MSIIKARRQVLGFVSLKMCEHSYKFHILVQILRRSVDAPHAADSLRPSAVSLSVRPDIWVIYFSLCWSAVENRRGTYHRNALYRSKRIRPPNSSSGTCIPGNRYHVSDTSGHGLHHCNRRTPILLDRICRPFQRHSVLHRRSKPFR